MTIVFIVIINGMWLLKINHFFEPFLTIINHDQPLW